MASGKGKQRGAAAGGSGNTEEADQQTDLVKLMEVRFDSLDKKISKIDAIETKIHSLEILLRSLTDENKELKAEIKDKNKMLDDMQKVINNQENRLNHLDQHHRSWAARVLNVPLTKEEEQEPSDVIQKVYDLVMLPVLTGAKNAGKLKYIPTADQLIEVAHTLPGKPGENKPIIMRFYNRNMKAIIFRNKREYAPRIKNKRTGGVTGGATGGVTGGTAEAGSGDPRGKFCFPLYEDLTKANLSKMREITADSRTQACWSVNGQLRFKLVNSDVVRKVNSITDSLDTILG
jgi:FtsZ-binding cell division protein ZapB